MGGGRGESRLLALATASEGLLHVLLAGGGKDGGGGTTLRLDHGELGALIGGEAGRHAGLHRGDVGGGGLVTEDVLAAVLAGVVLVLGSGTDGFTNGAGAAAGVLLDHLGVV